MKILNAEAESKLAHWIMSGDKDEAESTGKEMAFSFAHTDNPSGKWYAVVAFEDATHKDYILETMRTHLPEGTKLGGYLRSSPPEYVECL